MTHAEGQVWRFITFDEHSNYGHAKLIFLIITPIRVMTSSYYFNSYKALEQVVLIL